MKKAFLFLSIFLTATFINAQESGLTKPIYEDIIHEKYSGTHPHSEIIEPFDWGDVIPDINESENHPNGFDGLPVNCYEKNAPSNCYDQEDKIVNDISKTANDKKTPIVYISVELKTSSSSSTSSYDISFPSVDQSSSSASPILITPPPAAISTVKFIFKEGSKIAKTAPYKALCLLQEKKYSVDGKKLEDIYPSEEARNKAITKDGFELSDNNPQICSNTKETFKIQKNTSTGLKEVSIDISGYKDGGLFTLVGKTKKPGTKVYIWTNILKIRIIPYTPIVKEFVFFEFDGSDKDRKEWDPLEKEPENSITEKSVLNYFNKVYKQAAAKARITIGKDETGNDITIDENTDINKIDMSKKFKINSIDLIEVNMTENILSPDRDRMVNAAIEYFAKYGDPTNQKSKYFHIVFAINKEKKTWKLENCIDKSTHKIDLTSCNGFNPESEPDYVEYYITEENCLDKEESTSAESLEEINSSKKKVKIQKKDNHYYAIKDGEAQTFKGCENLHTDNGYPILLGKDAKAGGISRIWDKELLTQVANKINSHGTEESIALTEDQIEYKKHLPYGSFIFVKRSTGERGQYTVAHELGHSFGLTDVAVNHSEKTKTELSSQNAILVTRTVKKPPLSGTTETNLMTVMDISGPKIRYRDTPIACTMGKQVRLNYKFKQVKFKRICKDKEDPDCKENYTTFERCTEKSAKDPDCQQSDFTTIEPCTNKKEADCKEETFTTYIQVKAQAKDRHENQWECFRNCYREQLISNNRYKWWWSNTSDLGTDKGGKNECYIEEDLIEDIMVNSKNPLKEIIDEYNPPLFVLKNYYPLKEIKKFFSVDEIVQALYTPKELEKAGYLLEKFVHLYPKETLMAFYKKEELEPYDYLWEKD